MPFPDANPGPEHGLPHDQGGAGVGRGGGRHGAPPPGEVDDDDDYYEDNDDDDKYHICSDSRQAWPDLQARVQEGRGAAGGDTSSTSRGTVETEIFADVR